MRWEMLIFWFCSERCFSLVFDRSYLPTVSFISLHDVGDVVREKCPRVVAAPRRYDFVETFPEAIDPLPSLYPRF